MIEVYRTKCGDELWTTKHYESVKITHREQEVPSKAGWVRIKYGTT
jgi:hypothetical protein